MYVHSDDFSFCSTEEIWDNMTVNNDMLILLLLKG